jgi:hypothetical protein
MTNCPCGTNKLDMTDKLQTYSLQIDQALAIKDFSSLFTIFITNSFSLTELRIFYKRNKNVLSSINFWTSQLPHFHLEGILGSDMKITFLKSYFEEAENCNHELNNHLLVIAKGDFCKHFKLWQAFEHIDFLDSFKQISKGDSELARLLKELEIILKAKKRIATKDKEDQNYFLQFSFGEIVLGFTLYYYEFKQHDQIAGNKSWQTKVEVALVDELNNLISLFKGRANMVFQFTSNEELQKQFHSNEAPHHILGKQGLDIPLEPKFQLLFQLIKRLIERNSWRGEIQLYLCGYSDFESVILNPAPMHTNSSYRTFKINDVKSVPEELYFSNIRFSSFSNPKSLSRTETTSCVENLKFYGIPETIKSNGNAIELKKVFQLLKHFSVYKGTAERTFINGEKVAVMNQGDSLFRELFGSNESITLFELDKLVEGISNYFKWTETETKTIFSYLTFDISESNFPANWVSKPFIKYNNQVLWLGSFLKDRRWDNILLNKLKKETEHKTMVNTFSKNFELKIEDLFKNKSFKTISGVKFKSSNGQTGDFDLIAFKDNYLFVCEAKIGSRSNEFIHATYSETVRLEGCAADQLEKAIFNINEDWQNLKVKLGVNETVQLNSIKIVPLIVTDYFEGDLQLYKNAYSKTSLLELDVILKNKKKDLLEMYLLLKQSTDSNNPDLKQHRSIIKEWDLWNGKKEIEVDTIIQNIEQNTIWKELETVWKFEDEKYTIDY